MHASRSLPRLWRRQSSLRSMRSCLLRCLDRSSSSARCVWVVTLQSTRKESFRIVCVVILGDSGSLGRSGKGSTSSLSLCKPETSQGEYIRWILSEGERLANIVHVDEAFIRLLRHITILLGRPVEVLLPKRVPVKLRRLTCHDDQSLARTVIPTIKLEESGGGLYM